MSSKKQKQNTKEENSKELKPIDSSNDNLPEGVELEKHIKRKNETFKETLVEFCWEEPFYSSLSRRIHKFPTKQIPTIAVYVDRSLRLNMIYNENFIKSLKWYEREEVLKHEFLHLIFEHVTLRKVEKEKNLIWNWATDFAINSLLDYNKLPKGALYPGKWEEITEEDKKKLSKEQIKALELLRDLTLSLPVGQSSEFYYSKLMQDPETQKAIETCNNPTVEQIIGQLDSHDEWNQLTEEEKEIYRQNIKDLLRKAVDDAERSRKWGSISAEMQAELRKLCSNIIDWRSVLRNFVGMARSVEKTSTMKRYNKRYPYIHPGPKRKRTSRIAVAIDESGSVSNEELELCFAELNNLAHLTDFIVIPFDSVVNVDGIFKWKKGQKLNPGRVSCGGTDFSVPTRFVNENSREFDGFIIMTDGACETPIHSKVKRAYVITPGNSLYFKTSDLVINMEKKSVVR